jgi:hypothetical protein
VACACFRSAPPRWGLIRCQVFRGCDSGLREQTQRQGHRSSARPAAPTTRSDQCRLCNVVLSNDHTVPCARPPPVACRPMPMAGGQTGAERVLTCSTRRPQEAMRRLRAETPGSPVMPPRLRGSCPPQRKPERGLLPPIVGRGARCSRFGALSPSLRPPPSPRPVRVLRHAAVMGMLIGASTAARTAQVVRSLSRKPHAGNAFAFRHQAVL